MTAAKTLKRKLEDLVQYLEELDSDQRQDQDITSEVRTEINRLLSELDDELEQTPQSERASWLVLVSRLYELARQIGILAQGTRAAMEVLRMAQDAGLL